ncbi:nuclear transport factor 2 family protein [Agromyces sp. Soil535]|uniref:nuclear transport factor 2 family protein n=1 Tax=Agromyces sp. Soil535 TaxID=1736390 RepID=UPI0006FEF5BA|nr:nuclear transport factor 2 family protein [Agromyces sp. Soil535]KRE22306.1 hypothetical protein ASG80_10195 [Agromyces sp. Soil535]
MPRRRASIELVGEFIAAFNRVDLEAMRSLLSDSLVASVTNSDGTQSMVSGASAYVDSLRGLLELPSAECRISLTQAPVVVRPDWILVMLEIRATRPGSSLHNYSAQLFKIEDQRITEIRMTDAKPQESAEFWS